MYKKKIISLIGLMGAGKTTIGNKLAKQLNYYFVDSDREIEDQEHMSISNIFANYGEEYFRKVENNIIFDIINRDEELVLSVGGGAFLNVETRNLLKQKSTVIWLHASIEETLKRIGNKTNRPLLNTNNKREVLENMVKSRYKIYQECDLDFDTTKIDYEIFLNDIINKIKILNEKQNNN